MTKKEYKIILLGEEGVGKTNIINQLINNEFISDYNSSIKVSVYQKNIILEDNNNILFNIFDTSGQEKFRPMTKLFFKDSNAIILIYDITNKKSLKEIKNYWYKEINKENNNKNIIYVLVANKNDLSEKRKINDCEGEKFAQQIGASFFSISAKNNSGINELFKTIAKKIIK